MAAWQSVTSLVKKRAELAGDIKIAQKRLTHLSADLETLENTILMFDPDHEIETIKPQRLTSPR